MFQGERKSKMVRNLGISPSPKDSNDVQLLHLSYKWSIQEGLSQKWSKCDFIHIEDASCENGFYFLTMNGDFYTIVWINILKLISDTF